MDSNSDEFQSMRVKITGMHCANCAKNLQTALSKRDGIVEAAVDITSESADIKWNPEKVTLAEIAETVTDTGFSVFIIEKKMHIGGMHCAGCAKRAKSALEGINGVIFADINITDNTGFIKVIPSYSDLEDEERFIEDLEGKIADALSKYGFEYIGDDGEAGDFAGDGDGNESSGNPVSSGSSCSVGCSVSDGEKGDAEEGGKKKITGLFHRLFQKK